MIPYDTFISYHFLPSNCHSQDPNKCIATEKEILSILPIKDLQQCENRCGAMQSLQSC